MKTQHIKKIIFPLLLIGIAIIPMLDLFHPGLPVTHDGQDHVARIANFYQNLKEGTFVPRWAANLNWGYGHPVIMFLYPLPSYIASFFHSLGFSFVDSAKTVFGLAFIASGLSMYFWIKNFLGKEAAFCAGLLYMFAPYRFVDIYVRGAYAENVAFVFCPFVLYFLLQLSKKNSYKSFLGTSISLACLILAHNALSLMFLSFIFLYVIYLLLWGESKTYFLKQAVLALLLGFGLAGFFWIPAYFEGKYTLRDIVTKGAYLEKFVPVKDFFYGPWSYGGSGEFTVQVGILHWILVLGSLFTTVRLYRQKNKIWIFSAGSIFLFFLTIFIMTSYSNPLWILFRTLQKFQFPWRFLSLAVFIVALLGGLFVSQIKKQWRVLSSICITILLLLINKDYWHVQGYISKPEAFYSGIYFSTTETGESAPIWSVRFMEHPPKAHIEVIEGAAFIKERLRTSTTHNYTVVVLKKARIRENTLFFPGWDVLVDGKKTLVQFQDPQNRGLMTFFVERGKHDVIIHFRETKLRLIADTVSLLSITFLIFYGISYKGSLWKRFL